MLKANEAKIEWSPDKKRWHVVIQVGAEVIKRWAGDSHESGDEALRTLAVQTAKDEGYELDPARVSVVK
jgi:hypothetical protein